MDVQRGHQCDIQVRFDVLPVDRLRIVDQDHRGGIGMVLVVIFQLRVLTLLMDQRAIILVQRQLHQQLHHPIVLRDNIGVVLVVMPAVDFNGQLGVLVPVVQILETLMDVV